MNAEPSYEHAAIWPKDQIRQMAKDAIHAVGGERAFEFLGPRMRRAIIAAAAWDNVRVGAMSGPITITQAQMFAIEKAMREAAGIDKEVDD